MSGGNIVYYFKNSSVKGGIAFGPAGLTQYDTEKTLIMKVLRNIQSSNKIRPETELYCDFDFYSIDSRTEIDIGEISDIKETESRGKIKSLKTYEVGISYIGFDIKKLNQEEILEIVDLVKSVNNILKKYPRVSRPVFSLLWISIRHPDGYDSIKSPIEKQLLNLYNPALGYVKASTEISRFVEEMDTKEKALEGKLDGYISLLQKTAEIELYNDIEVSDFTQEGTQVEYFVGDSITPIEIFDRLSTSVLLPFAAIKYGSLTFFKITNHIPIPIEWIEKWEKTKDDLLDGLYFRISGISESRLESKHIKMDNKYAFGIWDDEGILSFDITHHMEVGYLSKDVFASFRKHLDTSPKGKVNFDWDSIFGGKENVVLVRGFFQITGIGFNDIVDGVNMSKVVMSSLIGTDDFVKKALFLDENDKSSITKPKYYAYFDVLQTRKTSDSFSLIFTDSRDKRSETPSIFVRVARVKNITDAVACSRLVYVIMNYYKYRYQQIFSEYAGTIGIKRKEAAKKAKTKNEKTGKLLEDLQKKNTSGLFKGNYSVQCPPKRQPSIVTPDEFEELKEKHPELKSPNRSMVFEDQTYVCITPEGEGKSHKFPGLKPNKKGNKTYKEKFSYLPCCFVIPQTAKLQKLQAGLPLSEKKTDGYVLGPGKPLPEGKFGSLPFVFDKILGTSKITKEILSKGKKLISNYVRYGVHPTPDSVIWCLESAINKKFLNSSLVSSKHTIVTKIKSELKVDNLGRGYQQTFGYSENDLRSILISSEFVSAELFHSVLEDHFKVNLFIFDLDALGRIFSLEAKDVLLPRFSKVYFPTPNKYETTVVLFRRETETEDYPYQYDLMCEITPEIHPKTFDMSYISNLLEDMVGFCESRYYVSSDNTYRALQ